MKQRKPKLLVVGTVAVDSVETPFGKRDGVLGGSATYFGFSASFFVPTKLVAPVGRDFPSSFRKHLARRPLDLSGLEVLDGKTFRWKGRYGFDLNTAETLETQLNVLSQFQPKLTAQDTPDFLFLANVDPNLQFRIVNALARPRIRLVAMDTMNFWIDRMRYALEKVLRRVDMVIVNDAEARALARQPNVIAAARAISKMGPETVIIKKGEHGVFMLHGRRMFSLPAFPLEEVFDPTGAGDSFAGGLMGYLAASGRVNFGTLKRAVAYGSVMASFAVEDFSVFRLLKLKKAEITERLSLFQKLSRF